MPGFFCEIMWITIHQAEQKKETILGEFLLDYAPFFCFLVLSYVVTQLPSMVCKETNVTQRSKHLQESPLNGVT